MTGFGRSEANYNNMTISVELKSVNHRYFEYNARVPRAYSFLDDALKPVLADRIKRGKVDLFVNITSDGQAVTELKLNHTYISNYLSALKEIHDTYGIKNDISVMSLAQNKEIFSADAEEVDDDELKAAVIDVLNDALDEFASMRAIEGKKLADDLTNKANEILDILKQIDSYSEKSVEEYSSKLHEKIKDFLSDLDIDEQRILTEVAIFADKVAIDEESVRLKSHIEQFIKMLNSDEAVGRKLDFLVQEMNRETNTIGSKSQSIEISRLVVETKAIIEKIREQIQNIE